VDRADPLAAQPDGVGEGARVGLGERLQDRADELGPGARLCETALDGPLDDPAGHVAGGEEALVGRVEGRDRSADRRGLAQQLGEVDLLAGAALPGADRLREQPQPGDVLEESDSPVDAALVGEVGGPTLQRDHRLLEFDADERPGATGDVREVLVRGRHGDDGRGRVVRADGDDAEPGRGAELGGDGGEERAEPGARLDQGREDPERQIEAREELVVPRAGVRVEQTRGGGVGDLGRGDTGQPVADQVRDEQRLVGEGEHVALGGELEQRVEGEVLQSGARVELLRADPRVHVGDAARRPLVTVVVRRAEHPAPAQQGVVDGPGVDADRDDLGLVAERVGQPGRERAVQLEDVPVQRGLGALLHADGLVREARDVPHPQFVVADVAEDDAPAGGAEVDRRDGLHRRTPSVAVIGGTPPRLQHRQGHEARSCARSPRCRGRRRRWRRSRGRPRA
jgi:hypothetical protein